MVPEGEGQNGNHVGHAQEEFDTSNSRGLERRAQAMQKRFHKKDLNKSRVTTTHLNLLVECTQQRSADLFDQKLQKVH